MHLIVKRRDAPTSQVTILTTYQMFCHLVASSEQFVYINISLLIFSVIEIYQPLEFLYIL